MGVKSGWCNSQVTAEPVDVLDQCYVHLQAPFATGLLGMSSVYAGAPRVNANAGKFRTKVQTRVGEGTKVTFQHANRLSIKLRQ